jgi:NADH-quinone oxidoreductase subunit N
VSPVLAPGDLASLAPEILLAAAGSLLLLLDAFLPAARRALTPLALAATAAAAWLAWRLPAGTSFGGLIEATPITLAFGLVVLLAAALALAASEGYLRREGILAGEYHALLLWCVVGLLLLVRARELLTVFLALELFSVCLYALAGFHRRLAVGAEAALKYFLMGAFVSAFALYGVALLYGETGSTRLEEIARGLPAAEPAALATLGLLMLVAAFAFKMALVPFHAWSPDAYQGAPSPFVAFLSVAPKAASAVVLVRLLQVVPAGAPAERWAGLVAGLAVASMAVGNLLALVQRDLKRMLAYSGVAHMGYLLIPLASLDVAAPREAWIPLAVYLVAYALMNAGAFALVGMLYARPGEPHLVSELSGWGYRYPLLGACLTVCLLSLGGIPPTVGFLGKYLIFLDAIRHGRLWLAVVGIAASLVGIVYYLRVVYVLYMKPEVSPPRGLRIDGWGRLAALVAAGATLALGIFPTRLLGWLAAAVERLP